MKYWKIRLQNDMKPVCELKRSSRISFIYENLIPDPDSDVSIKTALKGVADYILVKKENQPRLTEEELDELEEILENKLWLLK